jgi:YHS domain-containing protein
MTTQLYTIRDALQTIAAFTDEAANQRLARDGSYASFDEPNAVQIARKALSTSRAGAVAPVAWQYKAAAGGEWYFCTKKAFDKWSKHPEFVTRELGVIGQSINLADLDAVIASMRAYLRGERNDCDSDDLVSDWVASLSALRGAV